LTKQQATSRLEVLILSEIKNKESKMPAKIGRKVKNLKINCSDEKFICMDDFQGKSLVLYFYPKDNTSGCTKEAEDFIANMPEFKKLKCHVVGVSRDSMKSHHKFIEKIGINFSLISDPEEEFCNYFEVMKEKSMYGRKYMGIERSTFIISPEGKLLHEMRNIKVPGHVAAVLEWLK
jgi:peroxiredoxin Q/BCP